MEGIKNLIIDLGGVLINLTRNRCIEAFENLGVENIREQIFSAFFTTKPVGEGTGLGLSITRSIIEEKHDGKIEVESKEGEFTRFIFLIPLTK